MVNIHILVYQFVMIESEILPSIYSLCICMFTSFRWFRLLPWLGLIQQNFLLLRAIISYVFFLSWSSCPIQDLQLFHSHWCPYIGTIFTFPSSSFGSSILYLACVVTLCFSCFCACVSAPFLLLFVQMQLFISYLSSSTFLVKACSSHQPALVPS